MIQIWTVQFHLIIQSILGHQKLYVSTSSCIFTANLSFKHYITALLFSSSRLPFSEAQKKAVLSWAKELGAHDVPLLYALNWVQESVWMLVGNPTDKITACSGNIFYLNDVGKAIAKVCSSNMISSLNTDIECSHLGLCKPSHAFCNAGLPWRQRQGNVAGVQWRKNTVWTPFTPCS